MTSIIQVAVESHDEGDNVTRRARSQPPLLDAHVEQDLAIVQRWLRHSFPNSTPIPSSTHLEFKILNCQLRQEKRKGLARDNLMDQMWKIIKVTFS